MFSMWFDKSSEHKEFLEKRNKEFQMLSSICYMSSNNIMVNLLTDPRYPTLKAEIKDAFTESHSLAQWQFLEDLYAVYLLKSESEKNKSVNEIVKKYLPKSNRKKEEDEDYSNFSDLNEESDSINIDEDTKEYIQNIPEKDLTLMDFDKAINSMKSIVESIKINQNYARKFEAAFQKDFADIKQSEKTNKP